MRHGGQRLAGFGPAKKFADDVISAQTSLVTQMDKLLDKTDPTALLSAWGAPNTRQEGTMKTGKSCRSRLVVGDVNRLVERDVRQRH